MFSFSQLGNIETTTIQSNAYWCSPDQRINTTINTHPEQTAYFRLLIYFYHAIVNYLHRPHRTIGRCPIHMNELADSWAWWSNIPMQAKQKQNQTVTLVEVIKNKHGNWPSSLSPPRMRKRIHTNIHSRCSHINCYWINNISTHWYYWQRQYCCPSSPRHRRCAHIARTDQMYIFIYTFTVYTWLHRRYSMAKCDHSRVRLAWIKKVPTQIVCCVYLNCILFVCAWVSHIEVDVHALYLYMCVLVMPLAIDFDPMRPMSASTPHTKHYISIWDTMMTDPIISGI